jgi:hypothetical protein
MLQLRPYQDKLSTEATDILQRKGIVYLSCEVRTGKTITALETCKKFGAKRVLFITKIKAFSSIQSDYTNFGYTFDLKIINKESIHKLESNDFDIIVCDEAHGLFGTYPKPNNFTKEYRKRFFEIPAILLSGTMCPESYSQVFHQFWINKFSPFKEYANFYKWAKDFVNVKIKNLGYAQVNDYSDADIVHIKRRIKYFVLTLTQADAGFETKINEMVLEVEMKPITYQLANKLSRDLVVTNSSGQVILADSGVKLQSKLHQIFSGTIKLEDGTTKIIDTSKSEFIRDNFAEYKIGIFYKFKAEFDSLKSILGDKLTDNLNEFNKNDKWIALQYQSGREGISLKAADYLVFYNIDFSAVSYWQARDRLSTLDRKDNTVFWIFSKRGIESKIYKTVLSKRNFTLEIFKKEWNSKFSQKSLRS